MVTEREVLNEFDTQELDGARNISLPDEKLEDGSKGKLIRLAGQLRNRRNGPNQMASEYASKRSDLNTKTHERVDEAQKHRKKRDRVNSQVQEREQNRNEFGVKVNELLDEVDRMKSDLGLDDGKDINELKERIEQLKFRQQIEILSTEDEHELIEKIENKREEPRQRKDKVERSGDLEGPIEEAEEVRSEASQRYQKMAEPANDAQERHNQMIKAYREAGGIHNKADEIYELFVEAREAADYHHESFVRVQKYLRELDRKEERRHKNSHVEEREAARAEAEEIRQKFKGGETLGTEDLIKLQKSGLL